jgi:hypothetical protein
MGGHADAARAPEAEHLGHHVVVPRKQVEPVDRGEVLIAGLLHGPHVGDLGELGQEVVGEVGDRALGNVVDDHG